MGEPERAGARRWKCPMCGGNEWLFTVESFVLHRICKQCGFEVKEMADEALKKSKNLHLYSRAYKRAKVRRSVSDMALELSRQSARARDTRSQRLT